MVMNYNEILVSSLLGRKLKEEYRSPARPRNALISFMGEALGFSEGDVHTTRFYRLFLTLDETRTITDARVVVDGDLISPCSGYFPETLDEFDHQAVIDHCLSKTEL